MQSSQLDITHDFRRWIILLVGLILVLGGNFYKPHLPNEQLISRIIISEITVDLGIGLLVAAVVSLMFDVWYHKTFFGEPIEDIDQKVRNLNDSVSKMSETVIDFNQVLKSAQANGIHAIYRRNTEQEKIEWKERVRSTIKGANKYVLIMGRTLDELLPMRNRENGIYNTLLDRAKDVPIIFLVANTFDKEGDFRLETIKSIGEEHASSLYTRTRDSIKQILDLTETLKDQSLISVRLLKKGPPFALFMSEKSAMIEPYLPYHDGGESIIYEIHANSASQVVSTYISKSLHHAHKQCFGKLYNDAKHISEVIDEYVAVKSKEGPGVAQRYMRHQGIARKLKVEEEKIITAAELF
jgi:hypothetical protein